MVNSKRIQVAVVFLAAIISCYIGFVNKYPLVYPDTGTYLHSGFEGQVQPDRTIFYGLFARHISLFASLWLVILAQGLLVCYILFITLGLFFTGNKRNYVFIGIVTFLSLTTGLSYNVSILIPDIFSPITILCLINLLLNRNLNRLHTIFISILFIFSITTQLSNIPILIILFLFSFYLFRKLKKRAFALPIKKLILSFSLFISSLLLIPSTHYLFENKFKFSNGSHVFMLNHLLEAGILKDYLDDACEHADYKICKYKDSLEWDFIWTENGAFWKTGGWEGSKTEYNKIIYDVLTTPKYFILFIQKAIEYSFKQYFVFTTSAFPSQLQGSSPYGQITWRFKNSEREYVSSLQSGAKLDVGFNNKIQECLVIISMAFLFFILINPSLYSKLNANLKWLIAIVIIHGIISCIVCANMSTVDSRFQNRIVWMLPLCTIIVLIKYFEERQKERN